MSTNGKIKALAKTMKSKCTYCANKKACAHFLDYDFWAAGYFGLDARGQEKRCSCKYFVPEHLKTEPYYERREKPPTTKPAIQITSPIFMAA